LNTINDFNKKNYHLSSMINSYNLKNYENKLFFYKFIEIKITLHTIKPVRKNALNMYNIDILINFNLIHRD